MGLDGAAISLDRDSRRCVDPPQDGPMDHLDSIARGRRLAICVIDRLAQRTRRTAAVAVRGWCVGTQDKMNGLADRLVAAARAEIGSDGLSQIHRPEAYPRGDLSDLNRYPTDVAPGRT